VKLVKF